MRTRGIFSCSAQITNSDDPEMLSNMSKEKYFSLETFKNYRSVMLTDIYMLGLFSGLFRRDLHPTCVLWTSLMSFGLFLSFTKKEIIYIKSLTGLIQSFFWLFPYWRSSTSKLKILLFSFDAGSLPILPVAPHTQLKPQQPPKATRRRYMRIQKVI